MAKITTQDLEDSYNLLVDKLVQLKAAMVKNPDSPNYSFVKKTYWETREMAEHIAKKLGVDPVAV